MSNETNMDKVKVARRACKDNKEVILVRTEVSKLKVKDIIVSFKYRVVDVETEKRFYRYDFDQVKEGKCKFEIK